MKETIEHTKCGKVIQWNETPKKNYQLHTYSKLYQDARPDLLSQTFDIA